MASLYESYGIADEPVQAPAAPEPAKSGLIRRIAGDGLITAAKGAIGIPEAAVGLADLVSGGAAGKLAEDAGFRPKEAKAILDEQYSPEQKAAFAAVQNAANKDDPFLTRVGDIANAAIHNPSTIVHSIGESLPLMGAGGVIGRGVMAMAPKAAAWAAGGIGEGVTQMGSGAEQMRQETKDGYLTGQQSLIAAGSGMLTGGLGMLAGKVADKLGIGDVHTLLAGGDHVPPALQKNFVRKMLEGAASEGILEELPQSVQEQVAQNYALGKPLDEGVDNAAVMGVLTGGAMGVGAQGFHGRAKVPEVGPLSRGANLAGGVPPVAPMPTPPAGAAPAAGAPVSPGAVPDPIAEAQALIDAGIAQGVQEKAAQRAAMGVSAEGSVSNGTLDAAAQPVEELPPEAPAVLGNPNAEAFAAREQDRPAEPTGPVLDSDILNSHGKPFTTMPGAMTAQKRAGDTHEIVRVAGGLVVRQKATDGTSVQTPQLDRPSAGGQNSESTGGPIAPVVEPASGQTGAIQDNPGLATGSGQALAVPLAGTGSAAVAPSGNSSTQAPADNAEWTRMPHAERNALTAKTGMSKLVADKIARTAWADITPKTRARIEAAMAAPVSDMQTADAPVVSKPAAKAKKQDKTRGPRMAAYDKNPLLTFMATHGLYHDKDQPGSLKSEFSPDKGIMVPGYGPVFKKTGKRLDALVQNAIEDGYLPKDGTEQQLYSLIQRAVGGEKITPQYADGVGESEAQAQMDARAELEQEQHSQDNSEPATADEIEAAQDAEMELSDAEFFSLDDNDIPWDAPGNSSTEAFLRAMGATEQEIRDGIAQEQRIESQNNQGSTGAQEVVTGAAQAGNGGRSPQAGDSVAPRPGGSDSEGLTAPTRDDVLAQQDRADKAAKAEKAQKAAQDQIDKQERERKDIAKASEAAADTFTLGGDPMENLNGQQDVFSQPDKPAASANTIFTEDAAEKARAILKAKLRNLNTGLDPEMMQAGITLAGYHIEKGARTFAAYAKAMISDMGDGVKPYLKSWYMGVKFDPRAAKFDGMDSAASVESAEIESKAEQADNQRNGDSNAPSTNSSVERDSQGTTPERAMGDSVSDDAAGVTWRPRQVGGPADRGAGGRQQDGAGVPFGSAPVAGERGNQPVHSGNAVPELESILAGTDFRERGGDSGIDGVPPESIPTSEVDAVAHDNAPSVKHTIERNKANKTPVKLGDLENIRTTLPQLLPGQDTDVLAAEQRFAKPDGYGMLFTNGTGTGKTFTGLGIVKRFDLQGKSNILIAVPDEKIGNDWIDSGKLLGLSISRLESTADAGKGIVLTTYANLGENDALATRQWDLALADEAHTLMQSENGEVTGYLSNLRAVTGHPDGIHQRYTMLNRDEIERHADLRRQITANVAILNNPDTMDVMVASLRAENAKLEAEADALSAKLEEKKAAITDDVLANQGEKRTRLVALSATPFAYEKTIDWANGYLFDYSEGQAGENHASGSGAGHGYNSGDWREKYFMQHFGYRMRYNKLTQPDAKIDSGLLQRQWNGNLKKSGALSGRMLDVKPDYDRRFVLVDSAIGNRIDEALAWLNEQRKNAPKEDGGFGALATTINDKFKYLEKRYLLEAIKATEVVPIVKQHMAMGRKVVVFHDYKKGGGFNPFVVRAGEAKQDADASSIASAEQFNNALQAFNAEFSDLVAMPLGAMPSPIEVFKREFPGVMLINGNEKKSDLLARYKAFQDDATGPQVMLVQSAKNKGWSGHDTTGKHQRVLINLGQPTAPTLAIQQEGRIYRTGQASDAIMRYLNTGTNWERWTFASTIASRASTAENLGMGEMARALKDSFIQSFEESDAYPPGHEGEGKGGKERDKAANNAITEFDRAKTHYWATQKKTSRTKAAEGTDYFATPEPLGLKMVQWLDARPGDSLLEPSGGHGAIARWMPEQTNKTVIEPSLALRSRLALVMNPTEDRIIDGKFEDHAVVNKYDGIVMNPPFGSGGKTAVDHIAKAATHLRDGGRIVALLPTGPAADKKFDKWFYETSEKPVKPLITIPDHGPIYKGDTVTSRYSYIPGASTGLLIDSIRDGVLQTKVASGGRGYLTAITPESITGVKATGPRSESYSPSAGLQLVANIKLPQVTFERAGTAVATRVVVIEKTNSGVVQRDRDLSDIAEIGELFDRLENMDFGPRAKAVEVDPQEAAEAKKPTKEVKAEKANKAKSSPVGDQVTLGGKLYPVAVYTTNAGKKLNGAWVESKDEALKYGPSTFLKRGLGYFVRERDFPAQDQAGGTGDGAVFSTRESAPEKQLPLAQVERLVKSALSGIKNAPTVRVVANPEAIGLTTPPDSVPTGVALASGDIYVFHAGVGSALDVDRTIFHELFHKGLRNVMPAADYVAAMRDISESDDKVRQYASEWSDTPIAAAQLTELAKKYSGQALADHYEALATEEGLAMIAEDLKAKREMGTKPMRVRGLVAWLAKVADKIGMTRLADSLRAMSYNEAEKFVIATIGKAGGSTQAPTAFSRMRTGDNVRKGGLYAGRVQSTVNMITARWANAPKVIVVQNLDDPRVPESVRKDAKALEKKVAGQSQSLNTAGNPEGFIDNDTGAVFLIADALKNDADVVRVLMHESLGHFGLRGLYGTQLGTILDRMAVLNADKVKHAAKRLGLDYENRSQRRMAAEEVLAYMAQSIPEIGWVKKTVAAIRSWARNNIPGFASMRISDDELIRNFIIPARNWVEKGGPTGGGGGNSSTRKADLSGNSSTVTSYSRDQTQQPHRSAWDAVSEMWQKLAEHDSLFRYPKSDSKDFVKILAAIDPSLVVLPPIVNNGQMVFRIQSRDPAFSGYAAVTVTGKEVKLDVSKWGKGESGSRIYAAVGNWTFNTDRVFNEDDALTETSLFRRTENMLSLALKFGTTRHIAPGKFLRAGSKALGIGPLQWTAGDDAANMNALLQTSYESMKANIPALDGLRFNFEKGVFQDAAGTEVTRSRFTATATSDDARRANAGEGTIARTILTQSFLREENAGRGRSVLALMGRWGNLPPFHADTTDTEGSGDIQGLEGIAYSRGLGASLSIGLNNVREVKLPAGYAVGDLFQGEGRLHWWHKSVGSMYHLAQKSVPFKRVYDSIQNFLNDVSFYAAESADLAPSILPKLDKIGDVFKSPLSPEDTKALSAPVFEGTLAWGRNKHGVAMPSEDIEAELGATSLDDKAHMLMRAGNIDPKVLKMWQGLPMEQYEAIINGKFETQFMKPGVVFTPAELKEHFKMTDAQVALYQEFRKATDKSIDNLAISEMLNYAGKDAAPIREQVLESSSVSEAGQTLRDYLVSLVELEPKRDEALSATAAKVLDIAAHAQDMKDRGYAPLSRFGNYTLEATLATGERYFSLFETDRERNKAARMLLGEKATDMKTGTMSQESYKLLNGVSPETAALFGEMLGLESQGSEAKDLAFQEFIKRGTANRSAMKRLLKRKGIAGFSEDSGRVLAGFLYSNARRTASNLHAKETSQAVNEIPKEQGELKDAAVKLQEYVSNPQEEAQAFRGLLFAQYLGGSVASAMVNATQPFTTTLPYLSQFGGVRKAGAQMLAAVRDASKDKTGDVRLDAALKKAEEEGIVSPQEVHQLMAQAMGRATLKSGDGTTLGNNIAKGSNALSKLSMAWGKVFGVAEQFNRRTTFIAAYRTAIEQGIADPAKFAEKAVNETQFVSNKGNKPRWARGFAGSILFTFKSYSVNYLEMVTRMATAGKPGSPERLAGQKAAVLAIAILFLLAGSDGLPFVEDIEDVIDGAMQRLGYNFSSKQQMKTFLTLQLGKDGAEFITSGISGLPGAPIDVSGRMSMGNLIPGTGLLQKKTDHTRDLLELAGPGGDMVKRGFNAAEQALSGKITSAITTISPSASRNVVKAVDMADTGMYRDDKGRKIIDTDMGDAIFKGIGFQPRSVKNVQDASMEVQKAKTQYILASGEIRAAMAQAIFMNDDDMKKSARDALNSWNEKNPDQRMTLDMPAVLRQVREMRKSKEQRMGDTAPKAIRAQVRTQLKEELH